MFVIIFVPFAVKYFFIEVSGKIFLSSLTIYGKIFLSIARLRTLYELFESRLYYREINMKFKFIRIVVRIFSFCTSLCSIFGYLLYYILYFCFTRNLFFQVREYYWEINSKFAIQDSTFLYFHSNLFRFDAYIIRVSFETFVVIKLSINNSSSVLSNETSKLKHWIEFSMSIELSWNFPKKMRRGENKFANGPWPGASAAIGIDKFADKSAWRADCKVHVGFIQAACTPRNNAARCRTRGISIAIYGSPRTCRVLPRCRPSSSSHHFFPFF